MNVMLRGIWFSVIFVCRTMPLVNILPHFLIVFHTKVLSFNILPWVFTPILNSVKKVLTLDFVFYFCARTKPFNKCDFWPRRLACHACLRAPCIAWPLLSQTFGLFLSLFSPAFGHGRLGHPQSLEYLYTYIKQTRANLFVWSFTIWSLFL